MRSFSFRESDDLRNELKNNINSLLNIDTISLLLSTSKGIMFPINTSEHEKFE